MRSTRLGYAGDDGQAAVPIGRNSFLRVPSGDRPGPTLERPWRGLGSRPCGGLVNELTNGERRDSRGG